MEGDKTIEELRGFMEEIMNAGGNVWIKWTCPKCGDRVTANEANTVYMQGYKHEDCGEVYRGDTYGLFVVFTHEGDDEPVSITLTKPLRKEELN